nr:hypothetical protein CFP56_31786 [Quercus suber]
MAPLPPVLAFLAARFHSSILPARETAASLKARSDDSFVTRNLSPTDTYHILAARSDSPKTSFVHGQGAAAPESFNNAGFIALFAILGAGMVIASLWFFFWAKNGGFQFRQGDWDDYKSTVLRRKGPDGRTLSNATKSTKLGGSTIAGTQRYKWQKQAARSVVGRDEKGRKGVLAKRGWANTHSILYSDDYQTVSFGTETVTDMTETRTETEYSPAHHSKRYQDRDVQQYKREKPARVGGLNRIADGSHFDSDTNRSETMTDLSTEPLVQKRQDREQERAERKAREDAARMERRWKKDAEEAAAALARENGPPAPPSHAAHSKSAAAPSKPAASHHKSRRESSRSASPRKRDTRDFSYTSGPASEVLSTVYTASSGSHVSSAGQRSASYYDEYRPRATENPRYSEVPRHSREERSRDGGSRQSSPRKNRTKAKREGGYRRGADSDFD